MKILAIETATEALSVAIRHDDAVYAFHDLAPRRHGELLIPTIDRLLHEAGLTLPGLDAIAFGRGPGAFTGVRIAIAAAQGLAFAAGVPLVPVSTLATLAQTAHRTSGDKCILAAIDARMGEVYAGWFIEQAGLMQPAHDEWIGSRADLPVAAGGPWREVGTGTDAPLLPAATAMLDLAAQAIKAGRVESPESVQPVYLRDRVTG